MKKEMDEEKVERLILLVSEYKELYDMSNKNYSNQLRRDNIWQEIAKSLNENGKYNHWHNFRIC